MLFHIIIVALLTYLAWAPYCKNPLYQDQSLHYYIGKEWLKGRMPYRDLAMGPGPHLGLIYALLSLFSRGNEFIINFLSAGYIALGNICLFLAADLVYGPQAAFIASTLFAFYIFNPRMIGDRFPPESYAIPFCTLAFFLLIKNMHGPANPIYALLCGLSIGSATLIRQSTLIYVPLIPLFMIVRGDLFQVALYTTSFLGIHFFWIAYFFHKKALEQYIRSTIWNAVMLILFANPKGPGKRKTDSTRLRGHKMAHLIIYNSLPIFPLYTLAISYLIYDINNNLHPAETWATASFLAAGLLLIFPRKNFDSCYWLNAVPWAAILAGNNIFLLLSSNRIPDIHHYTAIGLLIGLFIFVLSIDYRLYFTLDPEKRGSIYDPQKTSHASWWAAYNKIGEYIKSHTKKEEKIQVLGHAARIYNKSGREAFFYSPSFIPFKEKNASSQAFDLFIQEIKRDYPEVIVLAGHMPAFPFNPKPYLKDLEEIQQQSGIVYLPRKFIDKFPIFFADREKSYISAIIQGNFLNKRLEKEKDKVSELTLNLERDIEICTREQALLEFVKGIRKEDRYEDIIHTVKEIGKRKDYHFSGPEFEFLMLSLGEAQYGMGQKEQAEKTFRSIIEQRPDSCEAFNNLGVLYFEDRRYREAVSMFEKALANDSQNLTALENIKSISSLLGDTFRESRQVLS